MPGRNRNKPPSRLVNIPNLAHQPRCRLQKLPRSRPPDLPDDPFKVDSADVGNWMAQESVRYGV